MGIEKKENKISKTSAILSIFHLFRRCQEVSYKEITDLMPIDQRTARRHILLLENAGLIQCRYSRKAGAYIPEDTGFAEPRFPEKQSERATMEKIIRLCTVMVEIMEMMPEDPVARYRELFPDVTDRTRQRDFAELAEIGYRVWYEPKDEDFEEEARWVYNEYVICNTYSLETFTDRGKW